jgi:hypothetical protein
VCLWNKILTPAEVTELYNQGNRWDFRNHSQALSNLKGAWFLEGNATDAMGNYSMTAPNAFYQSF